MKTLRAMFLQEIAEMLDCERQLAQLLKALEQTCRNSALFRIFEVQNFITARQFQRLEQVFEAFDTAVQSAHSTALNSLLGHPLQEALSDPDLFALLSKIDHYKLATYRCLRDWAVLLGNDSGAAQLDESYSEMGAVDTTLHIIARHNSIQAERTVSSHETLLVPLSRILSEREREVLNWLVDCRRHIFSRTAAVTPSPCV